MRVCTRNCVLQGHVLCWCVLGTVCCRDMFCAGVYCVLQGHGLCGCVLGTVCCRDMFCVGVY